MVERSARSKKTHSAPSSPVSMDVDDVFSSPPSFSSRLIRNQDTMDVSTPPLSPPPQASTSTSIAAGGEIERIRQALIEDHLAQIQEAETRRPDYLKRSKRPLSDVDSGMFTDERERDRGFAVGITESPNKGRRLKLFQETSEESFEESLMAGGYGRYPQPHSFLGSHTSGTPRVAETLVERVADAPPTEKELKKRKRLEAFRSSNKPRPRLTPVDLAGKGRVLLELPSEDRSSVPETPESSPSKKRGGGGKRKRKISEISGGKDKSLQPVERLEGPNWPDDEFPWRLRKEERNESEKAMEDERLKWIEKFLDRDTDEEDDGEDGPKVTGMEDMEEILPSAKWGLVYEDESDKPVPVRMGRGKMVPLLAHPEDPRRTYAKKKSVFPSDPGDARAALLAKKSVRALAYRNQRRQREMADQGGEDAVICICNGKDDGRELVQCDGCQTWYHLECIGIRSITELGREEDVWFCRSCVTRVRSPSPERALPAVIREPTFVPTDDAPRVRRDQDPTLYQPLHNSPLWNPPRVPKTPTRGERYSDRDVSSSSDSSRLPSTPQNPSHDIRLYNTPGPFEYHPSSTNNDLPFDPNTTPSRGIKFGAFATPNSFGRSFGSFEDMGGSFGAFDGLTRYAPNVEDSPTRRGAGRGGSKVKKSLESPLLSRPPPPLRPPPEESPVVRFQPQRDAIRLPAVTAPPSRDDSAYMR
ncbi:hypothetical protein P691DRAFT_597755 [Macrolepiota fuliginosa MF-IS2]|uniref:PHD-type domain-containing protein n=1 Tax=Macrolepiota fuliginosa MF-IS2 TaxID=1400762 RepID=A0A9P5XCH0_9AGAR|nr:hypothetical protein P691DRAFT_597755 [Macrolepiota fuliginosa MF-IS2]